MEHTSIQDLLYKFSGTKTQNKIDNLLLIEIQRSKIM